MKTGIENKKNNKGFSLIEIVVVLAIMIIMAGALLMSYGSLNSQQIKRAARTIDSLLTDTKTLNMAKTNAYFSLYKEGDYYYAESTDGTKKQLSSNKTLTVKYILQGGSSYQDITEDKIFIAYDKASGAFKELGVMGADNKPEFNSGEYMKEIIITLGNRQTKIVLYPKTGKHEIVKQ